MVKRQLPDRHNPLLEPEHTPQIEILVERRRLGSTDLRVKPGEGALSPNSKSGIFDYAHLRVPLPNDLAGTGIFQRQRNGRYPESYFLMRRSEDGYVSATGMFKAAFPWASLEEEQVERKHHKKLEEQELEEVAGNVWIAPNAALKLADEYNMRPWIMALLDNEPIEKGAKDKDKQEISTPPRFDMPNKFANDPTKGTNSVRGKRSLRSASPSKLPPATPSERKIASPRKRTAKKSSLTNATPVEDASNELSKVTQNGETPVRDGKENVRIEVDESVEQVGDVETTHTTVRVEMPAGHPDLPLPESAEEMVAKAREMVEEAKELEGRGSTSKSGKRKAAELDEQEDGVVAVQPVSKKTRLMQETIKREKIKTRALIGIAATFVVGSVIPYFV